MPVGIRSCLGVPGSSERGQDRRDQDQDQDQDQIRPEAISSLAMERRWGMTRLITEGAFTLGTPPPTSPGKLHFHAEKATIHSYSKMPGGRARSGVLGTFLSANDQGAGCFLQLGTQGWAGSCGNLDRQ